MALLNDKRDEDCEKRGYLFEEFRLFHLSDPVTEPIGYHYHDFHKILFFLKKKQQNDRKKENFRQRNLLQKIKKAEILHMKKISAYF